MKLAATLIALMTFGTAALAADPAPAAAAAKPAAKPAGAAKSLTLLVTGDNRGEIAPCG